jgi:hypothetical protein
MVVTLCGCGVREVDHAQRARPPVAGAGGTGTSAPGGSGGGGISPNRGLDAAAAPGTDSGTRPGDASRSTAEAGTAPGDAPPAAGGPPVSGVTVSINGTLVPREKAIVILHLGHSNMAGRAQDPVALRPYFYDTDPRLWQYQRGGLWTPAREPLCGDGGTPGVRPSNQGAGPGMALLRRALAVAPDAYIISIGRGESLDYDASCFSFRKGGLFYDTVAGPAAELKGKVTFAGLFIMLSYDARTDAKAQNGGFLACLQAMAADFRGDLGEPNLPFIQGDYERGATEDFAPNCCGAPGVIAQLAQVPMAISHSFLIPSDGIEMQDNHHYDMAGHREWADRAFKGMAANAMLPWATVK